MKKLAETLEVGDKLKIAGSTQVVVKTELIFHYTENSTVRIRLQNPDPIFGRLKRSQWVLFIPIKTFVYTVR